MPNILTITPSCHIQRLQSWRSIWGKIPELWFITTKYCHGKPLCFLSGLAESRAEEYLRSFAAHSGSSSCHKVFLCQFRWAFHSLPWTASSSLHSLNFLELLLQVPIHCTSDLMYFAFSCRPVPWRAWVSGPRNELCLQNSLHAGLPGRLRWYFDNQDSKSNFSDHSYSREETSTCSYLWVSC